MRPKLPRAADQGGLPRRHRRADREPGRSAQGARIESAGRSRDRPPRYGGDVDRGDAAQFGVGQLAGGGRPRRRGLGDRGGRHFDGRFELVACGPGELAAELARLSPAEVIADEAVPGIPHERRQGRLREHRGRTRAEARFGLATLDGLGSPSAPNWRRRAGWSPISTLPRRARGSSSTRRAGRARRATWRSMPLLATASELVRSVGGSAAGSLLGEIDRCQTAAGRRLLCEDICRAADRPRRDRCAARARRLASRGRDPPRTHSPGAESHARLRPRARRGWRRGAGARAISRCCATGSARRRRSARDRRRTRPPDLLDHCCRGSSATTHWSIAVARAGRIAADRRLERRVYRRRL